MKLSLFPKTVKFEELFLEQISLLLAASNLLDQMCQRANNFEEKCQKIADFERQGDKLSGEISRQLDLTFITPIDREDIHEINKAQEDVLDLIKVISNRIGLQPQGPIPPAAREMARDLRIMLEEVAKMLDKLGHDRNMGQHLAIVKDRKRHTDRVLVETANEMYTPRHVDNMELLMIMRWTRIYDRLERAVYRTLHLAKVIQGVVVKNA